MIERPQEHHSDSSLQNLESNLHNSNSNIHMSNVMQLRVILLRQEKEMQEDHDEIEREKQLQAKLQQENLKLLTQLQNINNTSTESISNLFNTSTISKDILNLQPSEIDDIAEAYLEKPPTSSSLQHQIQQQNKKQQPSRKTRKTQRKRTPKITTHFKSSFHNELDISFGDSFICDKPTSEYRLCSQNICGLVSKKNGRLLNITTCMGKYNIDGCFTQESHVNTSSSNHKDMIDIFNQQIQQGKMVSSNTHSKRADNKAVRYGGITSFLSPSLNRRCAKTTHDKYGRYHYHSLFTRASILEIYNLYRVNHGSNKNEQSAWSNE